MGLFFFNIIFELLRLTRLTLCHVFDRSDLRLCLKVVAWKDCAILFGLFCCSFD